MSRDQQISLSEAKKMVGLITSSSNELSFQEREAIAKDTVANWSNYYNKGFLDYFTSVTQSVGPAVTEWVGQGSKLYDVMGREYIDMLGGFGIYIAGIRHPKIVEAVKAQLDRSPQSTQGMLDPLRGHLAKVLSFITPGDIQNAFFINSGTEAVEGAMKLAKLYTGKKGFIAMHKGFHGKTLGALSLMGKAIYREPLLPLLDGVRHVAFGDALAVEKTLESAKSVGDGIAAVVAEPIQGEAGAIVPPDDFWPRLREICNYYNVLLIADEVQTGFGRTGRLFGVDHWDVVPDIMCLGKALGGGVMPMSAYVSTSKIWQCMEPNPFMHTTTTGGNPLACAAALSTICVMLEEDLPKQAMEKGEYLLDRLMELQSAFSDILIGVQGKGLLIGMQFPSNEIGYKVASGLFSRKVITGGTLINAEAIRIEPALNVPYELLDIAIEKLEATLKSI